MKGKHLALLLLLALLAGAAWYLLTQNDRSGAKTSDGAGSKVLDFPINEVARVTVKATGSELNLVKKGDDWVVQERADYPAAYEQVSDLIRKLWELKTVQETKVGPSQFARLDLVEPGKEGATGTLAELKDKDGKALSSLLLGKKYMKKSDGMAGMGDMGGFPAGRYVTPLGSTKVSLVSDTLDEVEPKADKWLKRDFFKIDLPKTITLEGTTDAMKWKLTRETSTGDWKLDGAKPEDQPLDATKVSSFANLLSSASFTDVLAPDAKPEETGLDKPTVVTFTTFDKFTYVLKIGKPNGENLPVQLNVSADLAKTREPGKDEKPEDKEKLDKEFAATLKRLEEKLAAEKKLEARPYLMSKATLDVLLKDRNALLTEKKPETPPPTSANPPGTPIPGATPTPVPPAGTPAAPMPAREPITVTTPPVSAPPLPPGVVPPPAPKPATVPEPGKPASPAPGTPPPANPPAPGAAPAPEAPPSPAPPKPAPTPEPPAPAPEKPAAPSPEKPAPPAPEKAPEPAAPNPAENAEQK